MASALSDSRSPSCGATQIMIMTKAPAVNPQGTRRTAPPAYRARHWRPQSAQRLLELGAGLGIKGKHYYYSPPSGRFATFTSPR